MGELRRKCVFLWIFVIMRFYFTYSVLGMDVTKPVLAYKDGTDKEIHNNLTRNTSDERDVNQPKGNLTTFQGVQILKKTFYSTENYVLPDLWRQFCSVHQDEVYESEFTSRTQLTSIRCTVTLEYSGIWTMADLRESLDIYKDSNMSFVVDIECRETSNISLYWPLKVHNLFKLSVKGCNILDFLLEQNSSVVEIIPDSLRIFKLRNSTIIVSISRFIEMLQNIRYISKEYDCGHEDTMEVLSLRNVRYDFLEDLEVIASSLEKLGENFILDTRRIPHRCDYKRLMTLDEGHSDSQSLYHMDLITDNAIFYELRTYNMSYNNMSVLKDQHLMWSSKFPKLEMFDLSHNQITKLYTFAMPLLTRTEKVTTINLQYNKISSLTVADLERFKEFPIMFIDLRNNQMDCNCSEPLRELLHYIHEGNLKKISNLSDYTYIENLKCQGPENLFGMTLKSLSVDRVCEPVVQTEYFLVPLLILAAIIVILSILLFMVVRFRQEITIILFTRFNVVVPCQTRENYDSNKKYDAFVSYSSNEEEFVEKLFEELESPTEQSSRPVFKFCMHHRDFVPGRTIFDNVTNSVESSRHTIILLSNHFLKSEFCLYEFQEAFRQSIMEKKRHLVIVMLEEVPEETLPRDLKRCIKTFTYIKKDDYLFTERLIYALSVKQKEKTMKKSSKSTKESNIDNLSSEQFRSTVPQVSAECSKERKPVGKASCSIDSKTSKNCQSGLENNNLNEKQRYKKKTVDNKLDLTIKQTNDLNLSPVERKLMNKDLEYDRSISLVSQDTGYYSDRGSIVENLSPDVSLDMNDFPPQEVVC